MTTPTPPAPLQEILQVPTAYRAGAPVVVLLHGRGAQPEDLMALADWMPSDAALAYPRAPFPGAQWGYGAGYAWYRFLGGAKPEAESFSIGQRALGRYLDGLIPRLPETPGPLILGGFSQGGTCALAWALSHPGRVAGVIILSGFVAEHPEVTLNAETAKGLRVFWGHGTQDGNVPFSYGVAGRSALSEAGAIVSARDYPVGHTITREELDDIRAWLQPIVTRKK